MSLIGGVLTWSARRRGATVVETSALGLQLSDGTMLGRGGTVVTTAPRWPPT
jgi:alpha-glucosidase